MPTAQTILVKVNISCSWNSNWYAGSDSSNKGGPLHQGIIQEYGGLGV